MDENKKNEKNNNPQKTTNENHIKVSVVIPVYNTETFLNECLDSIISQTLEDIEIICVDDGSTDNSLEILKAYESLDNRIKVYTIPNSGAGAARNFGMKKAKGEYLSFLDSDDYFEPDMLKKAYEAAKRENVDITIVRCDEYIQSKGIYKENNWSIMPWMLPHNPFCASDIPNKIFNIGCGWAWDKLFRRDFVLKSKVSFQEQRTTNDLFFVYSLYTKANSIYVIDEVLAHQRTNLKESLSVTREKSWDNFYKALIAIKEGLIHDGTYDIYKQSFVNWSLNFSLWNIHTLDTKISQKLRKKCRTKYFKELDISDNTKDYFYNEKEYERMMDIMEGNVKVSIIVPVYNAKEYINTCIDSLISQTFTNIEIICIDDGSDDGSADILKGYQDTEYRLRVFTIEHTNAGAARNIGLEKAVGEYIAFVDVDDFVQPDWLELVLKNADDSDADIIWFRCNLFDHKTNEYIDCPWTLKTHEMPEHRPFSPAEAPEKIFNMGSCKPWDKLYKRQFLEDNKIRFQSISTSNDLLFTFAALAMSGSITTMDDVLYHQRVNHPRVLGQDIEYLTSNYYKSLMALKNYLIENDIYKECKKSYINWALDFSLWSLHSFASPFDDLIRQQLKIKFFEDMDIYGTPQEDFYNHEHYNEMMMIMSERTELEPKPLPKVSIIIPIYNVAHYLPLALDSAIYQTLNDIEIICVNDGSTDNSLDIINEYAAKDPRIVVLTGENRGYGHAMNQGLDAAKGEYIGIIEPDDFVDVNMYEKLYETAKDHNLDIVKGDFYRFTHDDFGNILNNYHAVAKKKDNYNKLINPQTNQEVFNFIMNTWAGIYKKELIEKNKIRHNETPSASFQDNGFWFFTLVHSSRVLFVDRPYYYNRRDNPNSSVASREKVFCMNEEYDFILKKLNENSELRSKFIYQYNKKRFNNFIFTFDRISDEYKLEYLQIINKEIKEATNNKELDWSLLDRTEFEDFQMLMDSPGEFAARKKILSLMNELDVLKKENGALKKENISLREDAHKKLGMLFEMCCDPKVSDSKSFNTNKVVHIVHITDENYCMPTSVALTSLKVNRNPDTIYKIHIVASNVSVESKNKLLLISDHNFNIDIFEVSQDPQFESLKKGDNDIHVSPAAIIKLSLSELFPDIDKLLYLDGDVLIQGDLLNLYNTDINDKYLAAVKDIISERNPKHMRFLNYPHRYYFNSGMMLMNLRKMRSDSISHKLIDYRLKGINHFMDQDALNVVLGEKVKWVSPRFNFLNKFYEWWDSSLLSAFYEELLPETEKHAYDYATVLHLGSHEKPWIYDMGYLSKLYDKYYNLSPYADIPLLRQPIH